MKGKKKRRSKRSVVGKESDVIIALRKAIKFGDGVCITLPKEWVEKHKIKPGDELPVLANSILKIVPMKEID